MIERLQRARSMIGVWARMARRGEVCVGDQAANVVDDPVQFFLRFHHCINKQ
jgi:hypothetical protein